MKVLFVTSLLGGQSFGGAEISTRLLLENLTANGCEVKALTTRKVSPSETQLMSISFPLQIPKKLLTIGNSQIDYLLSYKIKEKIQLVNPDVIHVQDTYILPATVLANKNSKVPSVITVRNAVLDRIWELMFPSHVLSYFLKKRNRTIIRALNSIDSIISVSEYTKTELIECGVAESKITTIYNLPPSGNIPISKSANPELVITLLAPGLLASFKGFAVVIKAMAIVVEQYKNIRLIVAGDGPQKGYLKNLSEQLHLTSYVVFAGNVSFSDLFKYYRICDIVIFPSIYPEPFGRVALEALFFNKPVVASKVGGIPEIIEDKKTGLLVPPDNPKKLAETILVLIQDVKLREIMGQAGQRVIQTKFNPDQIIDQTLQLYKKTVASRN